MLCMDGSVTPWFNDAINRELCRGWRARCRRSNVVCEPWMITKRHISAQRVVWRGAKHTFSTWKLQMHHYFRCKRFRIWAVSIRPTVIAQYLSYVTSDIYLYTDIIFRRKVCFAFIVITVTFPQGDGLLQSSIQRREVSRPAQTTSILQYIYKAAYIYMTWKHILYICCVFPK